MDRTHSRRLERSALLGAIAPLAVDLGSTLAFYALFALTADPPIAASHLPAGLLGGFERAWAALLLGTGALNVAVLLWAGPARAAQVMGAWVIASKLALFAVQYIWCRAVARPSIKAQMQQDADGASGG